MLTASSIEIGAVSNYNNLSGSGLNFGPLVGENAKKTSFISRKLN